MFIYLYFSCEYKKYSIFFKYIFTAGAKEIKEMNNYKINIYSKNLNRQ